jgi:hypothetical protein
MSFLQTPSGTERVTKVPPISRQLRLGKSPRPSGKVPAIRFLPGDPEAGSRPRSRRISRLLSIDTSLGIVPVSMLKAASRARKAASCPICEGIFPERSFPPSLRDSI